MKPRPMPPRAVQVAAIESMRRRERAREEFLTLSRELAEWREAVARRLRMKAVHP